MEKFIIQLKDVAKKYAGRTILEDVNMSIYPGHFYLIKGPNGSGKTTLLKILAGLIRPDRGKRLVDLKIFKAIDVGYVVDNLPNLNFSAFEYLYLMGKISGLNKDILNERIKKFSAVFGFQKYLGTYISNLSKGTRQKIAIVQALLQDPFILIMDEPFSGLDENSKQSLLGILKEYKKQAKTIVIVSHESEFLKELVDNAFYLYDGRLYLSEDQENFIGDKMKIIAISKGNEMLNIKEKLSSFSDVFIKSQGTIEILTQQQYTNRCLSMLIENGFEIKYVCEVLKGDVKKI